MATYGNSNKGNTGKKYRKRSDNETPTAQNLWYADHFKDWFGAEYNALKACVYEFDDEIFTETFLKIYENISFGAEVYNYKFYFLRAYHTARLAAKKKAPLLSIEDIDVVAPEIENPDIWGDFFEREILEYVRGSFDAATVSIFEMYVGLQPISCQKLAQILGLQPHDVWLTISAIKKDLHYRYAAQVGNILSQ